MKVHIKPYIDSRLLTYIFFEKTERFWIKILGEERKNYLEDYIACTKIGEWVNELHQKYTEYLESKRVNVQIDNYDVWSMDSTLAEIILPMLYKLKDDKDSFPLVDDDDVPAHLKSTNDKDFLRQKEQKEHNGYIDKYAQDRWDYVINEMIFSFTAIKEDYPFSIEELDFGKDRLKIKEMQDRIDNGLVLFGKYFRNLWT